MQFLGSTIHHQLRQQTHERHARLHTMLPLLDPHLTSHRLHGVLRAFYGFYAPVEDSMSFAARAWLQPELRRRKKTHWLVTDLLALGETEGTIAQLPCCRDLPRMECLYQVVGVLYVLEGASLGGQVIARALRANIGQHVSCRFFTGYGDQVTAMWESFLTLLVEHASTKDVEREIVASACLTFEKFEGWLDALSSTYR